MLARRAKAPPFTAAAAKKIQRATERVLSSPPSRTGDQTPSTGTESFFWGMVLGSDATGSHFTFVRVVPNFTGDSGHDFKLSNGMAYRIHDVEDTRAVGLARKANGNKAVPGFTVALMQFAGYDRDGEPAFMFQYSFDPSDVILPPHDHRDNFNGGLAFACYHPGTSLPQQPWAM